MSKTAPRACLVGGGIASLAAAAFMIRDADMFGQNITILEQSGKLGGSLDGGGSPEGGYMLRGGRMLESQCLRTLWPVRFDPMFQRNQDCSTGNIRVERNHEDGVQVAPVP